MFEDCFILYMLSTIKEPKIELHKMHAGVQHLQTQAPIIQDVGIFEKKMGVQDSANAHLV